MKKNHERNQECANGDYFSTPKFSIYCIRFDACILYRIFGFQIYAAKNFLYKILQIKNICFNKCCSLYLELLLYGGIVDATALADIWKYSVSQDNWTHQGNLLAASYEHVTMAVTGIQCP